MDLDTIITLVFLMVFFILPSIFKTVFRVGQKIKPAAGKKKPSVIGKIREQIQAFVRELEEQARRQKQQGEAAGQKTFWDEIVEESPKEDVETFEPPPVPHGLDPEYLAALKEVEVEPPTPEKIKPMPPETGSPGPVCPARGRFRSNPLQNAVVWSEIIGKPVALRDD